MKSVFRCLLWLPLVACLQVAAQSNSASSSVVQTNADYRLVLVTNWVNPWPGLRTVGGQLYDINYSELWQWLTIPADATVLNARYDGSVQPIDLTFTWGGRDPRNQQTVVVFNYPYDPSSFRHSHDEHGTIVTASSMTFRVFPINTQTNWSPLGKMWVGQRTYDYGLPYTSLVPVASWQRVAVNGIANVPPTPTPVPSLQQPELEPPGQSYFSDSLTNRFEQVMSMTSIPQRDSFLTILAGRAAREGNVAMAKLALQNISSLPMHDNAAALVAQTLAGISMRSDAFAIVNSISDARERAMLLQELSQ